MAERRRSAHAGDDQNNGGTLSAKKPRDPQSSYLYRSVDIIKIWCVRYLMGNSYFRPAQSSKPFDTSAHWFEPVGNWEDILYAEFASSCDLHLHGGRYSAIMYQKRFFNLLTRGQCMFMHCYFVSGPTEN